MDKLQRKLKGFQRAPRDRFFLLAMGVLTTEELVLYELALALSDWDEKHVDTYGTLEATNAELAQVLGWKSDSTVSRHKRKLIEKEFLFEVDRGRVSPKYFDKWQWRKGNAEMHNYLAEMQEESANLQKLSAKMQRSHAQKPAVSLVSYKDDFVSFEGDSKKPPFLSKTSDQLTDEELLQIFTGAKLVYENM